MPPSSGSKIVVISLLFDQPTPNLMGMLSIQFLHIFMTTKFRKRPKFNMVTAAILIFGKSPSFLNRLA